MTTAFRFFACVALVCVATAPRAGDTARVLFIGNSFTGVNDLPEMFRLLAASTPTAEVVIKNSNTPGGTLLMNHSTNAQTLALIDAGGWDYVVLQEQSQVPAFPAAQFQQDVVPYAKTLSQRIRLYNPCARIVFYNTWGYKNGDVANCSFFTPLCTYSGMDSMLRLRYRILSDSNDAYHCPVGPVWRRIRAVAPGLELYDADERHPALAGTYAAACAFYTVVFGKNPMNASYTAGLPSADAAVIRQAAKIVVFDSLNYWRQLAAPLPAPTAAFTRTAAGSTVNFASTSTGATTYRWTFGDGSTATTQNATRTYAAPGTYTVKLVVMNNCKVADSTTQTVTVSTTSVGDLAPFSDVVLLPNPAADAAWLRGLEGPAMIQITDARGGLVGQQQAVGQGDVMLDLARLTPGLYAVRAVDARGGSRMWTLIRR